MDQRQQITQSLAIAVAVVMTPNGTHHFVSKETCEQIYSARNEDLIELDDGTGVKVSAITEVMPVEQYYEQFPDKKPSASLRNYTENPMGFEGVLQSITKTRHIELLAKGLKKARAKLEVEGRTTRQIDSLLEKARVRYMQLKNA